MQVEGVNAVSTTNVAAANIQNNNGVNSATNVGDSNASENNIAQNAHNLQNKSDEAQPAGAPEPLKSMSTSDFLFLHNTYGAENNSDSVMNRMMKLLEAVLALKLLDETLEAAQDSQKGNNIKEIA
tara:strand:+ start:1723 stop:2100 length:378 start_codon:yes stop_codon:yes gene_type:complete